MAVQITYTDVVMTFFILAAPMSWVTIWSNMKLNNMPMTEYRTDVIVSSIMTAIVGVYIVYRGFIQNESNS